ncbi:unnamed protein product [Chondrus crispus]|uniref:Uncharacterized protein n=1 Tax=Chondrus crispus TaxID=2769 RepID=R7Q5R4_CHOCR|nr:unnamed protein product [Chondrus crispus]CDF33178.1 unnamed protein product [Chondrus crispus]|eukprot:XP_005712981.1 unnamed protein product [Chondrus crispus]
MEPSAEGGGEALETPHWRIHGAASLPPPSTPRFRSRRRLAADRPAAPSPPAAPRLHLAPPSPRPPLPFRIVSLPLYPLPPPGPPDPAPFAAQRHAASLGSHTFPARCCTPLAPPAFPLPSRNPHLYNAYASAPPLLYRDTYTAEAESAKVFTGVPQVHVQAIQGSGSCVHTPVSSLLQPTVPICPLTKSRMNQLQNHGGASAHRGQHVVESFAET